MLSPIFGDKLYLNLVYFFCPWRFSTLLLSSVFTWISVQKCDSRFCLQNRFTFICVSCWCVECYKCLYCTFPKEDSPSWATLIFIKEKSELQWFVLDCEMSFLNKTSFNFPANIYSVLIPGKLNDLFLCFFGVNILKK